MEIPAPQDFQLGFRIGEFLVRPALGTIESPLRRSRVEPKVMDVLWHLAGRPGLVVGKEALLDAVWPETAVVEGVVARAISRLRSAFGDDARDPRIIQTISKRGYRLLAPVSAGPVRPGAEA